MRDDSILEETRAAREELLERFNYDLDALCAYLVEQETLSPKKAITLKPRRPSAQRRAS
jgi:hypothetical protein